MDCTYCGQDLAPYDAVVVERERDGDRRVDERSDSRGTSGSATREREGAFCNYGCLVAWVDETNATRGSCCRIDD